MLHGIWARGWVVPGDAEGGGIRSVIPDEPSSEWLHDPTDIKQTVGFTLAGLVVMGTIMYGPPVATFVAIAIAVVIGAYAFFRGVFGRF